jgi:hypothetical protein
MDRSSMGWSLSGRKVLFPFTFRSDSRGGVLEMTNYTSADIRNLSRKRFPDAYASENRKSFIRACTAKVLTVRRKATPLMFTQAVWPDDEICQHMLKGMSSPTDRGVFPEIQSARVLPMLAPNAASSRVLSLGTILDLAGLTSIKLPFVGGSGRPAAPAFVAEGAPLPMVDLIVSALTLGPTCKVSLGAAITDEIQQASAATAEQIVAAALAIAVEQGTDVVLFGNAAATPAQPAGILNGVASIPSAGTDGAAGVADDLGLIADAIGTKGISSDDLVFVATPSLAMKIRVLAGPRFQDRVFSSSSLTAGTVIGVAPQGLATGYTGAVEVETTIHGSAHMESTAPLPIVGNTGTVAAPTISSFQQNLIFLKVRAWCAWAIQPGAVAAVSGADW